MYAKHDEVPSVGPQAPARRTARHPVRHPVRHPAGHLARLTPKAIYSSLTVGPSVNNWTGDTPCHPISQRSVTLSQGFYPANRPDHSHKVKTRHRRDV